MDVFDLLAKLTLDTSEYEDGLNNAQSSAEKGGSKIGAALGTAAKVGGAALAAAGTAAVAVGKQALDSYGDFEQLSGGIETLYTDMEGGTQAVEKMMDNASKAWQTAGLSANEYMETAIESSAALINSLAGDVDKAADLMDLSIIDMADNVNKMGTNMEGVQNAYRGFSRGNFTMLDNLALGFAGTKEGMQQLLDKAKEVEAQQGRNRDFSIESYADIVEAIHIVQESMGIAGTTSKEASETIQGSLSAMKSAWANLVTGIADENADLDGLVNQFVDSISTAGENIIPRVEQILLGLGTVIEKLAPQLIEGLIQIITDTLPELVKAAGSLVMAVGKAIIDNLPEILDAGVEIVFALIDGIVDALPELIPAIVEVILTIVEKLTDPDTLMQLIEAAFEIIGAIAVGLINALPKLIEKVPIIIKNLVEALIKLAPQLIESGIELIKQLAEGVVKGITNVVKAIGELFKQIKEAIHEKFEQVKQWGADLIQNFIDGITSKARALWDVVKSIGQGIKNFLGFSEPKLGPLSDFHTYAPDMMKLFAQGIKDNEHLITDQISKSFNFGSMTPAMGMGGNTTNTYNITVNGIEELEELLEWYNSRQVRARMA